MKNQKVFAGIVFVIHLFMILVVVLLFQIKSTVDNIESTVLKINSTVDDYKGILDIIEQSTLSAKVNSEFVFKTIIELAPIIERIERLSLGIPLLMH